MNEGQDKHKREAGCLLLVLVPPLLVAVLYGLLYYNPMRLADRRHLDAALQGGLLRECDALLAQGGADYFRPARQQWPPIIRGFHPRGLFVSTREPKQVWIELWKNYREWERNSILGIWTEKGACGVSLIVYAATPSEPLPDAAAVLKAR